MEGVDVQALRNERHEYKIRIRDLKWDRVKEVMNLPKWKRIDDTPMGYQWRSLKGVYTPKGLEEWKLNLNGFKWGAYERLCSLVGLSPYEGDDIEGGLRLPLMKLVWVFGSDNEVLRFVKQTQNHESLVLNFHDAGQFLIPMNSTSTISRDKWKALCFKFPEIIKGAQKWEEIENDYGIPRNLVEYRKSIAKTLKYKAELVGEMEYEIVDISAGLKLDQWEFERFLWAYRGISKKEFETIPNIDIRENGYRMRKLGSDDPRGLVLGLLTNCCQHLSGAGKDCAYHGMESGYSAFFVIEKSGSIIAQSWVWRDQEAICFDSIEALDHNYAKVIAMMMEKAKPQIVGKLGIEKMLMGETSYGVTKEVKKLLHTTGKFSKRPPKYSGYMDGREQVEVL